MTFIYHKPRLSGRRTASVFKPFRLMREEDGVAVQFGRAYVSFEKAHRAAVIASGGVRDTVAVYDMSLPVHARMQALYRRGRDILSAEL